MLEWDGVRLGGKGRGEYRSGELLRNGREGTGWEGREGWRRQYYLLPASRDEVQLVITSYCERTVEAQYQWLVSFLDERLKWS